MAEFSDSDVKYALFAMSNHKSSGPNGFNACFFKKSWGITRSLICAAMQ